MIKKENRNEWKLKKYRECKNIIEDLCEYLNKDFEEIMGFNPMFRCSESMNDDGTVIYVTNTQKGLVFTFGCEYKKDIPLEKRIENIGHCMLIKNFYFRVNPTGEGIGTQLGKKFLKRVGDVKQFEKIQLSATTPRAIRFWNKLGFQKERDSIHSYEKMVFSLEEIS